jgi:dihydroorotase
MTGRDLALAELTGGRIHLMCVSTRDSVNRIRLARLQGLQVTADVTPHHLLLTDDVMQSFDPMFKCTPPLRSRDHIDSLIGGLRDGTITAISSDHQPRALEKKQVELDAAPCGICGLETALSVCVKALIVPGHLSWIQLLHLLTAGPAEILGLDAGTLQIGRPADITLIDPDADWTVDSTQFRSRSRNTPFHNMQLPARIRAAIVDGEIRYQCPKWPLTADA